MRILLVEPWLHGSHRRWAEGYRTASRHEVDVVGLPGGRWRWLLRAGALNLANRIEAWVAVNGAPDLLLVSGMVDVAQLLGLCGRALHPRPPVVVYMHESQLVYPGRRAEEQEAALRNWLSWCAADLVAFNSRYHLDALLAELPTFLDRQPEPSHRPYLDAVAEKFEVLPVGVDLTGIEPPPAPTAGPPVVVWPHRWEPDKDPDAFAGAVDKVLAAGSEIRLVLAGEDPPGGSQHVSRVRRQLAERFEPHVLAVGPFERDRYHRFLIEADIVVSCAHHEFFGIGVVEAVAAGCRPVLPAGLSYPELIPERWHDVALYRPGRFGSALLAAVADVERDRMPLDDGLAGAMRRFDWSVVAPRYDDRFEGLT